MLVNLTIKKEGLREYYKRWLKCSKECGFKCDITFEQYYEKFTPVDGNVGFYLDNDGFSPKLQLKDWYEEFTRETTYEEEFRAFGDITLENIESYRSQYGTADTIEQIKEYFKEQIEDKDTRWVIFVMAIKYHPENAGKYGGYRPYKSGPYIGQYQEIRDCEYYDDCEFDDDYQGYLIKFHIIPVK